MLRGSGDWDSGWDDMAVPEPSELRLSELRRYPLKSCAGEQLSSGSLEPWGLAGDRRWMLVDAAGAAVTAREYPHLLLIRPRLLDDGGLEVRSPGAPGALRVARPAPGPLVEVSLFGKTPFGATPGGSLADTWFSELLGTPVRLVYADDPARRPADPAYAGAGVPLAFADGYPLLLATEASLTALNEAIANGEKAEEGPIPMVRFRPNLVVAGGIAWAEDGWRRLRIGAAEFAVVKGCARCAIPTTDEQTALRRKEPTYTLAKSRRWAGKVWFAINLVPLGAGHTLRVGDEVEILDAVAAENGPIRSSLG